MTYPCDFVPSRDGGHWHQSQKEADQCKATWANWNVWDRTKGDLNPQRTPTLNKNHF